jgi:peptidoglycan/LPS O-acetylase OafA/YrhL
LLVECASAAILVGLIAFHGETRLLAPLDLGPVRFYGKISYRFYLLHRLSLWSSMKVAQYLSETCPALPISIIALVTAACSVVATTPFAYVSWRFIELPAMSVRRRPRPFWRPPRTVVQDLHTGEVQGSIPVRAPSFLLATDRKYPDRHNGAERHQPTDDQPAA